MRFDFAQIAVPFRMQPGLHRLAAGTPQLTPLAQGSPLYTEKQRVYAAGASRFCQPGFDPTPAINSIAAHAATTGLGGQFGPEAALELAFEEDLAVLDAASGTVPWLCVCVPSHWAPEDRVGLGFAAIHAPVADNATLLAASDALVRLVCGGDPWERFVWNLVPDGRFDQHPGRHPRQPWPDDASAEQLATGCWLRVERQTFLPVRDARGQPCGQSVFTIRVMLQPLTQAVRNAGGARRLHDALASMSDATLAYKQITPARERLLQWLSRRATGAS
jgi:hypothetical protein